ncbi:MAG TPA: hypothetical protein VHS28_01455, partial [Chloroflexota bacterium]|nr:hypothetical protein [Chloroflexota bacterium]
RYGAHSVHAAGQRTSVKAYHKGPEFSRHDSRRLRHYLQEEPMGQDDSLPDLQAVANRLLRIEVEIRHRKLCDDGANPLEKTLQLGEDGILRVGNVTVEYLTAIHDQESRRLLREGAKDMQTVRTFREVETRLGMLHSATLARSLFSTWVKFATLGEEHAKKGMCRRTFYLHRKQLVAAGCSWHESDIHLDPVASKIPAGFSPVRWDPRRLTSEHPRVAEQLELLRKAA